MKKKYYCDYCDKRFKNDLNLKRKHLAGIQHQMEKLKHYAKFRDLKTLFIEESKKSQCYKFIQFNYCKFGDDGGQCRYTHYTKEQLETIKKQLEQENDLKNPSKRNNEMYFNEFIQNEMKKKNNGNFMVATVDTKKDIIIKNLPISLQFKDIVMNQQYNDKNNWSDWG